MNGPLPLELMQFRKRGAALGIMDALNKEKELSTTVPVKAPSRKKVKSLKQGKKRILETDPWSRIQDEALKRHEGQLNALISEYEENGDSDNVVRVKAENALLPVYRKDLRKVLLEYLQWVRAMKKSFHLP